MVKRRCLTSGSSPKYSSAEPNLLCSANPELSAEVPNIGSNDIMDVDREMRGETDT